MVASFDRIKLRSSQVTLINYMIETKFYKFDEKFAQFEEFQAIRKFNAIILQMEKQCFQKQCLIV
jgi:hypothetical protein